MLILRPSPTRRLWFAVALVLAVFLPLAWHQVRWSSYAQIALLLPYSAALGWLLQRLSRRLPGRGAGAVPPAGDPDRAVLAAPARPGVAAPRDRDRGLELPARPPRARARAQAGGSGTVLAMADYGPEILYRTAQAVLSIPNHRPQPGFAVTLRILTATDPAAARAELERAGVDWILLCPSPVEREMFAVRRARHDPLSPLGRRPGARLAAAPCRCRRRSPTRCGCSQCSPRPPRRPPNRPAPSGRSRTRRACEHCHGGQDADHPDPLLQRGRDPRHHARCAAAAGAGLRAGRVDGDRRRQHRPHDRGRQGRGRRPHRAARPQPGPGAGLRRRPRGARCAPAPT